MRGVRRLLPLMWLALWLAGCTVPGPSVESSAEGERSVVQVDPDKQTEARDRVAQGLNIGLARYHLVPGDAIEVLFLTSNAIEPGPYVINVGDRLRIEFHYIEEAARTLLVRPDGAITLPIKGDFPAAGRTPPQLAAEIEKAYADIYRNPRVTVVVEQYTSKMDDLRLSLSNSQRGRSQRVVLSPDGQGFLPYLPGLSLTGLTVDEARDRINGEYRRRLSGVEVSVLLDNVTGNRVFVFGEVPRPGLVQVSGNMTALQAVAAAGGPLPTGSLDVVKVMYWSPEDKALRLRTVNLTRVFSELKLEEDLVLPGNSTVYVPPTAITVADRAVDQYLRQLFLFNGTSIGFNRQSLKW